MTVKYSHFDFVKHLGEDYREECKKHFASLGLLEEDQKLLWLSPDNPDYTHPGSSANYLLWMRVNNGKDLIIVSAIPPKSFTSAPHDHPKDPHVVIEKYKSLKGEFDLLLNGNPKRIKNGKTFNVLPGIKHRVKTNGGWALIAIVMENGGLYPPDRLHRR